MSLVSIISPSYNQVEYIEDCIRSVLRQNYPDFEYIIIDGASTDGSVDVIQKYSNQVSKFISEADHGQADAINKGFKLASGKYIAWLNSDDIFLPNAILTAVRALEENPQLGMVYGNAISIDASGRLKNKLMIGNWEYKDLLGFRIICQPAVFMRRTILEQVGGLDPTFHYMLDHQLWLRIAQMAPIQHIPVLIAAARHHTGAKNVAMAHAFSDEILRLLHWIQTNPELQPEYRAHQKMINGGAYRLNARYLMDGGYPGEALRSYLKALVNSPSYTLKHWHRILYAFLCILHLHPIAERSRSANRQDPSLLQELSQLPGISNWPGFSMPDPVTANPVQEG